MSSILTISGAFAIVATFLSYGQVLGESIESSNISFDNIHRNLNAKNYSNPSDPFRTNQYLQIGHSISRSNVSTDPSYYQRALLIGPLVIFILGILSIIILNFTFLFRCCCRCCKCLPTVNPEVNAEDLTKQLRFRRRATFVLFYIFCALALAADQFTWIGNVAITKGTSDVQGSLLGLERVFINLSASSAGLKDLGSTLERDYNQAIQDGCFPLLTSKRYVTDYQSATLQFYNSVSPVPARLNTYSEAVDEYGNYYRNIAFYVVWALAIASVFLMVIFNLLQWRNFLKTSMLWTMITYLLELLVTLVFMILTSATADVCSPSPSYNIVNLIPPGQAQDLLSYYSSCVGPNKLANEVRSAENNVRTLNETLTQLHSNTGFCRRNPGVAAMLVDVGQIFNGLGQINVEISCPPIRSLWFQLVNDGLCTNFYTGFYTIWLSQLITSFFLFMAIILASFTYQYFKYGPLYVKPAKSINDQHMEEIHVEASAPPPVYSQSGAEIHGKDGLVRNY